MNLTNEKLKPYMVWPTTLRFPCPNCRLYFCTENPKKDLTICCPYCKIKTKIRSFCSENGITMLAPDCYDTAKKILKQYGYSRRESEMLLFKAIRHNNLEATVSVQVLLKLALSFVDQAEQS